MNQAHVLNFQDFIGIDGEQLTTDSLKVAQVHRKRHADVLRLIRLRMTDAGEWGQRNFALSSYVSEQGKDVPVFTMTRDGYTFLVGKLTGKLATQHQIAYIEAFNAMAAFIKNQREPSTRCSPTTAM
ncbi:MAG: Rha family transcriptional regulator [Burkholderiaceae bacterium]